MTRSRGVLYVTDYKARVGVQARSLVVRTGKEATRVPVHACEAVVMTGGQMTAEAVDLCMRSGIRVAALRRTGRLRFIVTGGTSGNVLLRLAQFRAVDGDVGRRIAEVIVAAKLESYRRLLNRWADGAPPMVRATTQRDVEVLSERIAATRSARTSDHLRGIEGDGTRRYFRGLGAQLAEVGEVGRFESRSRRPPRDPVNALLSFLYGLSLVEVVGALDAIGLDPQIGYLHQPRPGRPSLALDLLEEHRPLCDRQAVRLLRRREVRLEHFARYSSGAWLLNDEGRKVVLSKVEEDKSSDLPHPVLGRTIERWQLPTIQATLLARHLRGDLAAYPPFVVAR